MYMPSLFSATDVQYLIVTRHYFVRCLDQLRKLSWNGIPKALRGTTWRLLSVNLAIILYFKIVA